MSFEIVCNSCGAPSSPSVGICPFCKSVMSPKKAGKDSPTITRIKTLYNEGKMAQALSLVKMAESSKPKLLGNANFILLYVKILIEVDGPSSKIKSLIGQALLDHPDHPELLEYMEVIDARSKLFHGKDDAGELELANLLRRSPNNVHALFLLGSHLFWIEKQTQRPIRLLEQCHRLRPNFLRANACLGALYKSMGLDAQAARIFRICAKLETDKEMKAYFKSLA